MSVKDICTYMWRKSKLELAFFVKQLSLWFEGNRSIYHIKVMKCKLFRMSSVDVQGVYCRFAVRCVGWKTSAEYSDLIARAAIVSPSILHMEQKMFPSISHRHRPNHAYAYSWLIKQFFASVHTRRPHPRFITICCRAICNLAAFPRRRLLNKFMDDGFSWCQ